MLVTLRGQRVKGSKGQRRAKGASHNENCDSKDKANHQLKFCLPSQLCNHFNAFSNNALIE